MAVTASPPAQHATSVVLAEDHPAIRSVLGELLDANDDIVVVDAVSDAAAALASVTEHRPTVLVLNLTMPGEITALDAIPRVSVASAETAVVVVSMQADVAFVLRALELGALAYVLKEDADPEIVEAVRRAAAGQRHVPPALNDRVLRSVRGRPRADHRAGATIGP
jgi:DNA-binding NarL/FixJ family response regulator